LDEARKNFEYIRRERGDSFPLSEGSKEYLETFAEDHARYGSYLFPQVQTLTHL